MYFVKNWKVSCKNSPGRFFCIILSIIEGWVSPCSYSRNSMPERQNLTQLAAFSIKSQKNKVKVLFFRGK
jgi:hypothetical protein